MGEESEDPGSPMVRAGPWQSLLPHEGTQVSRVCLTILDVLSYHLFISSFYES